MRLTGARCVRLLLALLLVLLLPLPGAAQPPVDGGRAAEEALQALNANNLIKLREKAAEILKQDPNSIAGNYFMGYSLHQAEGDLARAHFHLEKARRLFETRFGTRPTVNQPYGWLLQILGEHEMVCAEMDHYEHQLELLDAYNAVHVNVFGGQPPAVVEYAWPLMKLGREQEARARVRQALERGSSDRMIALNTLGAIEMESGNTQKSYQVFEKMIEDGGSIFGGCTILRNAGEASLMVGEFESAERYFLQAADYFEPRGFSNPWWDLANLYLAEARFPEAVEALKATHLWTLRMEAFLAQQNYAENQQITAEILLQLGYTEEALTAATRAVQRPDRQGGNSNQRDQWEAGNLILYRAALRARDQAIQEEMSWSRGTRWWQLYLERQRLGFLAWSAGRRAVAIAVRHGRLQRSLRAYSAGTIMMADWHRPDLVELYGPGVTAAALAELRGLRSFDDRQHQEPYLQVLYAEVITQTGDRTGAVARLDQALKGLNPAEALVRSRAQARAAELEYALGRHTEALGRYQQVLETAPGMLRLLGQSLPVRVEGGPSQFRSRLLASPRFRSAEPGFRVKVEGLKARLLGPDGTVLAEATGKDPLDLVRELHEVALSPRISLDQTDLTSLDGSNLSGTMRTSKLKEMFGEP